MKQLLKIIVIAFIFNPLFAISQTNKKYIVVGYSSICCGTPTENHIIDYLKSFEIKNRVKLFEMFKENGLGKEGEFALYIGTDNLSRKLIISLLDGLKMTATKQNKLRIENRDGYVNVEDKYTSNSVLKGKKSKPRNRFNYIEIYHYQK